jgi:hypothetical protein
MIKRVLLLVAAAAMFLLAPSAAMADYQAPGFTSTVSDATPVVNQCIHMTVTGGAANAGKVFTLNVTGPSTMSLPATANKKGVATFKVCLKVAGSYTLTVKNAAGAMVAEQTVTVHAPGAAGSSAALSQTGSNVLPFAGGGALLVLVGIVAVFFARRRTPTEVRT